MNINFLRGLLMLAFACIGMALVPTSASAQAAPAAYDVSAPAAPAAEEQNQVDEFSVGAEAFFDVVHLVKGVPLSRVDYRQLRDGKPVIFSTFNTEELRAVGEKYGWNSDKVRRFIDSKLSKEGNAFVKLTIAGGNILRETRFKGVDMDSNCTVMESFIIADGSNGVPVNTHTTCTGNWQATLSTAVASAIGQSAVNVVTLGTQFGLQELAGPQCPRGGCVPQQVFNLQGGTALAASEAVNQNSNLLQQGTEIRLGGPCGTGNCPTTPSNPHPAGSAQPAGIAPSGNGNQ